MTENTETKTTADTEQSAPTPVSVLGLGPMGRALAAAFLAAGHPTTVWNRTPGKAAPLAERGAAVAETAAAAAAASPLVVACVMDHEALHSVIRPAAEALRGTTLVNLTSNSAGDARETASWAAAHGIDYLDGAILTPTPSIGGPEAVYLYSGPEALYERHGAALAALGGTATHLGADPGRAAAYDAALLDFFWTAVSGYVHALALARTEGVDPSELAPFATGIVSVVAEVAEELAQETESGRHSGEEANLRSALAGIDHILGTAEGSGLDNSVLAAVRALAARAVADGHGEDGISRLVETLARPSS
ncbi:NAD(P)-binding domain-containing protein [Streptomyces boncukensis]|uniref:NAD(P)-dependent oxidoreductase n=1 Tax=Streptomyces boncukensis TaxID=2711219 RepID=A0A6G4WW90_9ACTN|nr:NAD(P)-binding domain-containing protein [Streptomyces boncukensis]NGO69273.1 NAD(P)-dependent oxidoreductase [Streptomyces boncukensis]